LTFANGVTRAGDDLRKRSNKLKLYYRYKDSILVRNVISLFSLKLISYLASFLVVPYIARFLTKEEYGLYLIILSCLAIAGVITNYGLEMSGTYSIAINRDSKHHINSFVSNSIFIKIFLSVISCIVFNIYLFIFIDDEFGFLLFLLLNLLIFTQALFIPWFYQGIEKMSEITKTGLISQVVYVLLVLLLLPLIPNILILLSLLLINHLISVTVYIRTFYKHDYKLIKPTWEKSSEILKDGAGYFVSRLSVATYTSMNVLFIGSITGSSQAAVYGSAEKVYKLIQNLLWPINSALFPYISRTKKLGILLYTTAIMTALLLVAVTIIIYNAELVMQLIFGDAYIVGADVLRKFMVLIVITYVSASIGYNALSVFDKIYLVNYTVYFGAVVHIIGVLSLVLLDKFSINNMLLWIIFVEIIILLLRSMLLLIVYTRSKKSAV